MADRRGALRPRPELRPCWSRAGLLFGVGGLAINLLLARLVSTAFAGRELALAMGIFNAVYPASMIVMFTLHPKLLAGLRVARRADGPGGHGGRRDPAPQPRGAAASFAESPPPTEQRREPWLSIPLVALAVSWLLFFAAYASIFTFAPEWAGGGTGALLTVSLIPWVGDLPRPDHRDPDRPHRPRAEVVAGGTTAR